MSEETKTNEEYWRERNERNRDKFDTRVEEYEAELQKLYKQSAKEMEKTIAYYYTKFAQENYMTYQEAVQFLNRADMQTFRMSLQEYVDEVKNLGTDTSEAKELQQELDAVALNSRIRRVDAMLTEVSAILSIGAIAEQQLLKAHLTDIYREGYYTELFDLAKFYKIDGSFNRINEKFVHQAISYPWSGDDFSSRIWTNKDKMITTLRQELTKAFIQGNDMRQVARTMSKEMDVKLFNATTLVRTESAAVISASRLKADEESKVVERYVFDATLDSRTTKKCQKMDRKIFPRTEAVVGVNIPPLHPRCRSDYHAYFSDEKSLKGRNAKTQDGKWIRVPGTMTYDEFKEKYL